MILNAAVLGSLDSIATSPCCGDSLRRSPLAKAFGLVKVPQNLLFRGPGALSNPWYVHLRVQVYKEAKLGQNQNTNSVYRKPESLLYVYLDP